MGYVQRSVPHGSAVQVDRDCIHVQHDGCLLLESTELVSLRVLYLANLIHE